MPGQPASGPRSLRGSVYPSSSDSQLSLPLAPSPSVRYFSIVQQHASQIEDMLNPYYCLNLVSARIQPSMAPVALMAISALEPESVSPEQRFPGVIMLLYDDSTKIHEDPERRKGAVFTRVDATRVDNYLKIWAENLGWVRESWPPSIRRVNTGFALKQMEDFATKYINAWHLGVAQGFMGNGEFHLIDGPALGALVDIKEFWLQYFQC